MITRKQAEAILAKLDSDMATWRKGDEPDTIVCDDTDGLPSYVATCWDEAHADAFLMLPAVTSALVEAMEALRIAHEDCARYINIMGLQGYRMTPEEQQHASREALLAAWDKEEGDE